MAYLVVKGIDELSFYEQEIELAKVYDNQKYDSLLVVGLPENKRSENIYALGHEGKYIVLLDRDVYENLDESKAVDIMHKYYETENIIEVRNIL